MGNYKKWQGGNEEFKQETKWIDEANQPKRSI
jgi:hypothetical protein